MRRSRRGTAVSAAPAVILDSCEYVVVDDETALVRVTGTGLAATIVLLARTGDSEEVFEPLADAGELPPLRWRAAFPIPASCVTALRTSLVLDVGGFEVELERPADEEEEPELEAPAAPPAPSPRVEQLEQELATARASAEQGAELATQAYAQLAVARSEGERLTARVAELEGELESFVSRRDEALAESAAERVAQLEAELQAQRTCIEDLQSMLVSERETTAKARDEAERLRDRLEVTPKPVTSTLPDPVPGWTALDDELLGRLEKAKELTQP